MKTNTRQKLLRSTVGVVIAVLLFIFSSLKIPFIDAQTDNYFNESITKAGVAYASCRVVNASVSVIQNSTLQLEPAGVGVSLAVGQVLDPIDDMTERLSDVLVTSIVSLGVQKLAYEISVWFAPTLVAILILIFSILIWIKNERIALLQRNLLRITLLVIVARLCLPISSLTNEMIHKHFFSERIEKANHDLSIGSADLDKFTEFSLPKIDGIMGTIENSAAFLSKKSREFKNALTTTVNNMGNMIDSLLSLTFLYVGLFIIQVIILPILSFWILVKLANALFRTNIPVILRHRGSKEEVVID